MSAVMAPLPPAQATPDAQQQWMHDLRNAVNAVGISIAALERAIARDDRAQLPGMLARARSAGERCRALLEPGSLPPG